MNVSLGGAPGPKTGGLNQIGAREVQAAKSEEVKPVETPPAPKTPAMTLPDPKIKPRERPKPERAPEDSNAQKVSTGEKPQAGNARTETRGQGFGTGLSSTGGSGSPVQLDDVVDFCCPEYIDQMRIFIQRTWENNQGVAGSTGVKFTIQRNGTIQAPQIEKPSGFDALDLAALRALQRTTLPPLPQEFPNNTLTVHMRFDYSR
jgi:protein TonB